LCEGAAGDVDRARLSDAFQPRRDVHTVSQDVVPVDDNLVKIDSNAELDSLIARDIPVAIGYPALNCSSRFDCRDDAWKLDEDAVAGRLDDSPTMFGDFGIYDFLAMPLEGSQCPYPFSPMRRL
jgi:hypothetical protein